MIVEKMSDRRISLRRLGRERAVSFRRAQVVCLQPPRIGLEMVVMLPDWIVAKYNSFADRDVYLANRARIRALKAARLAGEDTTKYDRRFNASKGRLALLEHNREHYGPKDDDLYAPTERVFRGKTWICDWHGRIIGKKD